MVFSKRKPVNSAGRGKQTPERPALTLLWDKAFAAPRPLPLSIFVQEQISHSEV